MSYKITFYCGAELVVETSPRQKKKYGDKPKSTARNGLLRVVVWNHCKAKGPFANETRVNKPNGERADCHSCRGTRRLSGRCKYECFPLDYETEKDKAYAGKRFTEFCEHVIACFPKTVVKITATPLVAPAPGDVAEEVNQDNELIEGME